MWIFTSGSFLSIVADRKNKKNLLVRGRFKGDIQRVFGRDVKVQETPHADYRFRASLPRTFVAPVISQALAEIDYDNFKDGVDDKSRKSDLMRVWSVMRSAQEREAVNMPPPLGDVSGLLDDVLFPESRRHVEYGK